MIAAGGTAGHVVPALAVADALRARGAQVTFIGGERAEAELVPAAGYPFHRIAVAGLDRRNPLRAARAAALAVRALVRARALLGELRPDAVMGGGGYVSGTVGLAAITRRIPLVLTEADSHLGIANRVLAPLARRVCLAFPIETDRRSASDARRYRVTGRPIPPPHTDRATAREQLGIARGETCVLVFGGSLGARSINFAALDAYAGAAFHVLHVCGRRDYQELSARPLPPGYDLRDYMNIDDFSRALAAADLVVARAGGSLFEVAAHGKPAILIPYPHAAADHQTDTLLADPQRLRAMAAAARRLARPDAADAVAEELLQAARG